MTQESKPEATMTFITHPQNSDPVIFTISFWLLRSTYLGMERTTWEKVRILGDHLKRLAAYHCNFDQNSNSSILIPELIKSGSSSTTYVILVKIFQFFEF